MVGFQLCRNVYARTQKRYWKEMSRYFDRRGNSKLRSILPSLCHPAVCDQNQLESSRSFSGTQVSKEQVHSTDWGKVTALAMR